ncbi:MAG: hypothetical protein WBY94_07175 [Polyangiaceae bacterium]
MTKWIDGGAVGGVVLVVFAGCSGRTVVDLGGSTLAATALAAGERDAASVPASCAYTGPYDNGSGYYEGEPDSCSAADGPMHAFGSTSDVANALTGSWRACTFGGFAVSGSFLNAIDPAIGIDGVEFTGDGRFFLLTTDNSDPAASMPYTYSLERGSSAADTGTFEVIDASASLGPGTFQVRMTAANGSVLIEQVVLYDLPAKLRVVAQNGFEEFSRPLPWTFRANVCGPGFGPPHTETSAPDFMARLTGRWAWCSGQLGGTNSIGVEFLGDGTWYGLVEDEAGNVTRQTTGSLHGTVQVPSDPQSLSQSLVVFTQDTPGSPVSKTTTFLLDECNRGLRFPEGPGLPDAGPTPEDFQRLP